MSITSCQSFVCILQQAQGLMARLMVQKLSQKQAIKRKNRRLNCDQKIITHAVVTFNCNCSAINAHAWTCYILIGLYSLKAKGLSGTRSPVFKNVKQKKGLKTFRDEKNPSLHLDSLKPAAFDLHKRDDGTKETDLKPQCCTEQSEGLLLYLSK